MAEQLADRVADGVPDRVPDRVAAPVSRRRWLLRLVLVVASTLATVAVLHLVDRPAADVHRPADHDGLTGTVLTSPYTLRDATLTDASGQPFPLHDRLQAPVTLLFFGYTHCADTCPAVLSTIASAEARLPDDERSKVATWFVTTDPARDDPATIGSWLARFDPRFTGLTGPMDALQATAGSVHVAMQAGRKLPSGGYEVVHGTPVLAVLPDGSVPVVWTEQTSAAQLAADLDTVLTHGVPDVGQAG